jgi:hypothetical protein
VGFHSPGSSGGYRSFEANEMCWGCHADIVPYYPGDTSCIPVIRIQPRGIVPAAGQAISLVELTGECFGDTYGEGKAVQLKRRVDGTEWIDMPISSWADDRVVFEIPCTTLIPGNYRVRVYNEDSAASNDYSNQVVFSVHFYGGRLRLSVRRPGFRAMQDSDSAAGWFRALWSRSGHDFFAWCQ